MPDPVVKPLDAADAERFAKDVETLYREAGWIAPGDSVGFIAPMLRNSFRVMGAFDSGRLVGMMRALSDGVSDAYLLDLVVAEEYRGRGLAKKILDGLVENVKAAGPDWIVCVSVPEAVTLYSRRGRVMEGHLPFRFR